MNAYPNPCGRLPPRFPIIARAVPRRRIIAPRPTLRAERVTINSRSSVSARIAAGCGFPATRAPPAHPDPIDADIDREMTNLCRCATYVRIRAAIHRAAKLR